MHQAFSWKLWAMVSGAAALAAGGACAVGLSKEASARAFPPLAPPAFSSTAEARLERGMDPAMVGLATRALSHGKQSLAGRPEGWAALDLADVPSLDLGPLTPEEAQRLNAFLPATADGSSPAQPFHLSGAPPERERALLCLSQAIYYEAALEPLQGQEAVAQTVLNRVRNPAFPHSVCGVIYEGSQQVTGCQFSFTCDGSRQRPPIAPFWQQAQAVARQALDGFVMHQVGTATHYHADYVFPRWGPTLVKIGQIGAHIFYRFPGPLGRPPSFREAYNGGETRVSMAGPSPAAILAAAKARAAATGGAAAGDGETAPVEMAVADPSAEGGLRKRVAGEIVFGRRLPTKEEIARINASLAAMDRAEGGAASAEGAQKAAAARAAAEPSRISAAAPVAGPKL